MVLRYIVELGIYTKPTAFGVLQVLVGYVSLAEFVSQCRKGTDRRSGFRIEITCSSSIIGTAVQFQISVQRTAQTHYRHSNNSNEHPATDSGDTYVGVVPT